jgi:diguanylate cyclase (GGDEF)-like protein
MYSSLALGGALFLFFIIIEYILKGYAFFRTGMMTVGLVTLIGSGLFFMISKPRPGNKFYRVTVVKLLALLALSVIAIVDHYSVLETSIAFIIYLLVVYLFIPNLFINSVVLGLAASLIFFYLTLRIENQPSRTYLWISMLLIHIFSARFSNNLHTLRRREFAELMREFEAKIQLNLEIQRRRNLESELRRLAMTDPLTGAATRHHFREIIENQINLANRFNLSFHLLLMDMDGFKQINDRFGHLVGDEVLMATGEICRGILRKNDILCRYGGDEFAFMIPDENTDDVIELSSRICAAIEERGKITLRPITVSIGIVKYEPSMNHIRDLIAGADLALYRAKKAGKNRAMLHIPDLDPSTIETSRSNYDLSLDAG